MRNDGCVCQRGVPGERGSGGAAPPGTVVEADTSACPLLDRCGILTGVECSRCPDRSWVNDGCLCRRPLSTKQFFRGLEGFLGLLSGNASTLVQMSLQAGVELSNPNHLGAEAGEGSFFVRYKGTPIGTAKTAPQSIGANTSTSMSVSVRVDRVPADVAMQMTQELLDSGNQLSLLVDGRLPARVGFLRVTCGVRCDLRIDTSQLPATVLTKEACRYSYGV
uniref:Late embryogenesis abundant protein LEA-2 subgroup domain-containing protein n=2 Tax=Alexandrium monilatum TaxID=311494 RepID=A0A7S4V5B8_9DINO